jgi:hypothetical protein
MLFGQINLIQFIMIMKRPTLVFATTAILTAAPMVFAAPFDPKDVAADPALLVHVDCDALRASAVGQSILSQPDVQDKLAAVGAIFDFDLRTQLHGLTVYTTEEHPKDGALIIYADFEPNRLITLAKAADGFRAVTNGSHVIYSWLDKKKKAQEDVDPRVYGAILGHRVIFGQEESHLAAALDVIDGAAPNYSGKKGLPEAEGGESILAEGVLLKFDFDSADEKAAIFKMAKSVRLKLSETGGNLSATVRLEAADADTATQMDSIAQGLLAVLKLQKGDANATKLANAATLKQDGSAVRLTLSMPSSELITMIKDDQKKKAAKAERDAQNTNALPEKN